MNLKQIMDEVNKDIDDELDSADLTGWINRALDICSTADKYKQRVTLVFDDGVGDYELPSDLIELMHVFGTQGEYKEIPLADYDSVGYKRWGNVIGFQNIDDISVDMYYHAQYPHLEKPEDVPMLHPTYHDLLVLYAVARARYQDEEESLENNVMGEFNRRLAEFSNFVKYGNKKTSVRMKTVW